MKQPKARRGSRGVAARVPDRPEPRTRLRVAAILLAGALTYANSLSGPFVFDDRATVLDNASIRDLRGIRAVLAPPTETPVAGRPLVNTTFAINYAMDGLDVAGYHVVNIALHLLYASLVFAIVRRTMRLLNPETTLYEH